jgi:ABC-type transport system involved in multi-copper enzyme maturation permease subunit
MWSRTFALFLLALKADTRLLHSHLMRMALLAFVGLMLMYAQTLAVVMGAPGYWYFQAISWINFFFATLAASFLFAAAITEEKEERTLGLLRMADVGPLPLLIGKSAPRLVAAVLILSVQFPFTLLAITLGGVSWNQVTAAFCTLLAHVVLVGGLALLFSVIFRRTGTAIGLTFLIMLPLIIIPPSVLRVLKGPPGAVPPPEWQPWFDCGLSVLQTVVDASAAPRLWEILTTGFSGSPCGFQVLTNLAAGGILFGLAWLLFDPCNRNLDDEVRRSGPVLSLIRRQKGRSRRAWRLAIVGKDFRSQAGGWSVQFGKLVAYLLLFGLIAYLIEDFRWSRVNADDLGKTIIITTFYFVFPIEIVLLASRLFRTELKDRTWPLLLSLPLSLPEIAYAKLAGALFALTPAVFCFCLGILLNPSHIARDVSDMIDEPIYMLIIVLYLAYLLLLGHLTTLFSVLSNAWAGALLGIVSTVMGIFANYMVAIIPIMLLSFRAGGGGISPNSMETYGIAAELTSLVLVLLIVGCVHYLTGVRLKSSAAQ